jgi:hypothetical protein
MTTAAIDLGATSLRVACPGGGITLVRSPDDADAVPALVWLAGPGDARVGAGAAGAPPGEVIATARADLLADQRATARDRYYHGRFESPESVAGYLLADAARRAGAASGTPARDILLGFPAAADDSAALRRAASAAGLTLAGTIAEPVAVALHYGAVRDGVDHLTLVHDLGGTSLDIAALRVSGRNVAIVRSERHAIGGRDWDEALARELLASAGAASAPPDAVAAATARRLRERLSDSERATAQLTGPQAGHEVGVDRARLEAVTASLLGRVMAITREAIDEATVAAGERPDTILLAGGANRMPAIARELERQLGVRVRVHEPQAAVVRGLAMARDFGLLFVTGLEGDPLSLPAMPPRRSLPGTPAARAIDPGPRQPDDAPVPPALDPRDPDPVPRDPDPALPGHGQEAPRTRPLRPDQRGRAAPPPPPPPPPPARGQPGAGDAPGEDGQAARAGPQPPPGLVPVGGSPRAEQLSGRPVEELEALRRGDRVLLTWRWPGGSVQAQVRWQSDDGKEQGTARCTRRSYEHEGGFELPVGLGPAMITVEALGYGGQLSGDPPSPVRVEAARLTVRYDPAVRLVWWRWPRRTVTVTFTSDASCLLPPTLVIRGTGGYMPQSTRDGDVVHRVPAQHLAAGVPSAVTFQLPAPRRARWLVCVPADHAVASDVDLLPASLHRLRVS